MTADALRQRRLALSLSRDRLALVAHLSRWTVRSIENGTRAGTPDTWNRLEAALRVCAIDRSDEVEQMIEALA